MKGSIVLKSGIIGAITFLVLILLEIIYPVEYEYGNPFSLIILLLANPVHAYYFRHIFRPLIGGIESTVHIFLALIVYGFLLGMLIGWIIKVIKKK